jgi:hypothetical protein
MLKIVLTALNAKEEQIAIWEQKGDWFDIAIMIKVFKETIHPRSKAVSMHVDITFPIEEQMQTERPHIDRTLSLRN